MANPFAMFKTDPELETSKGVIIDYGDFRICVGRAGGANKKYINLLEAMMKPYQRQLATNQMDDDVATRILVEVFAKTVVFGCDVLDKDRSTDTEKVYKSGILTESGVVVEDSAENRQILFMSLKELFIDLRKQATDFTLFLAVQKEETVGNS